MNGRTRGFEGVGYYIIPGIWFRLGSVQPIVNRTGSTVVVSIALMLTSHYLHLKKLGANFNGRNWLLVLHPTDIDI